MREAADEENAARQHGYPPLSLTVELIGERPSGATSPDSPIVQVVFEATRALNVTPKLDQASTDANLPISLGIPALTLGAGGASGGSHTLDEWYDPHNRAEGLKRGLLVVLGLVGLTHPGSG
jgi:di/tripeptidase